MFLMTLSPDFAAANYTIRNPGDPEVRIAVGRLPYSAEILKSHDSRLQIEGFIAFQRTRENVPTFPALGEYIESRWDTYGAALGILYERTVTEHLRFTPSAQLGLAQMYNRADYHGPLSDLLRAQSDGTIFNWSTKATVTTFGIGLSYDWKLQDRPSSVKADVYRFYVNSFGASNSTVGFSERANMLTVKNEMIFPTPINLYGDRLDFVALAGINNLFGQNRNALGYTTSYQLGLGAELPLKASRFAKGYVRLSGQMLRASNMQGWLLSIGYTPT